MGLQLTSERPNDSVFLTSLGSGFQQFAAATSVPASLWTSSKLLSRSCRSNSGMLRAESFDLAIDDLLVQMDIAKPSSTSISDTNSFSPPPTRQTYLFRTGLHPSLSFGWLPCTMKLDLGAVALTVQDRPHVGSFLNDVNLIDLFIFNNQWKCRNLGTILRRTDPTVSATATKGPCY